MKRVLVGLAVAVGLLVGAFALLWFTVPDPAAVAQQNPRTIAVIEQRRAEARQAHRPFYPRQAWIRMDRINPRLAQAVLASEDARFYGHGAFDWDEVKAAADESLHQGKKLRGASTLTQQAARTIWLGTQRSVVRKAREAVLAVKMEQALPKRRILALYLNTVEWGEGVFGAEAAARARFGVGAADLSTAQAAVLAAMLPAPRRVDLRAPSRWLARRSRRVLDRLLEGGRIGAEEHRHASAELERILAGTTGQEEEPPEDDEAGTS